MPRDRLFIEEMIDAAQEAIDLTAGVDAEQMKADRTRRDALLWNFTVLGEAASQISEETKRLYDYVNWTNPARLRNRVVHGYWTADVEVLVATAQDLLPSFVDELRTVLAVIADPPP
jgi:uncharacterized protein with HEPN domain